MEILGEIRYDRQNQIGVGEGMNSKVFRAFDSQLGGQFAAKEIEKSMFGGDITRYFEEAKAMFAAEHKNIAPIRYACQNASHIMLVMPYFASGSLGARISAGPITTTEFIRIALGVLRGVTQIHNAGYIHFDLKPTNVLFNDVDDPLVADFGQSRKILPGGVITVPPMYFKAVPPETMRSGMGSFLGDIYQLGLLFYRAINGNGLYDAQFVGADDAAIRRLVIAGKLPDRKTFLPHVPKRVRTIIRKALKTDPSERYQSAAELASAIARVPPGLNWETTVSPSGDLSWRAQRPGKADLEVQLLNTVGNCVVRVWTVSGTKRRAKNSPNMNRSGLGYAEAMAHLNEVFAQLA